MLVLYHIEQPSPYLLEASSLLGRTVDELAAAIGKRESLKGIAPTWCASLLCCRIGSSANVTS
jgi:hypothetical protein